MKPAASIPDSECILRRIGRLSEQKNLPVYAVGGFVRDQLMGLKTSEIDFVVVGDGPDFAQEARNLLKGHGWIVYPKFGTASFLVKDIRLEFVTARSESYRDHSRKPDIAPTDLAGDLSRRDFTINTLALSLSESEFGRIHDPFGGQKDIRKRLIRTPRDPAETFSEDPLRIMRAARFASQLGFQIHKDALAAMESERERLRIVSQERITAELLKILSHSRPGVGFRVLQKTGVLGVIFPELTEMVGVEQRDTHHHKDVFDHTLKVLDNVSAVSDDMRLRFTALVHDIGKPRVKRFVEGTGWTFHGHELAGVKMLRHIVPRLRLPAEYFRYARELTRLHMRPIQLIGEEVTDSAVRRLLVDADDKIGDLMILCRADITSGNPKRVETHLRNFDEVHRRMQEVEEKDRLRAFQSPVRGDEIMRLLGIPPGPRVGRYKKQIEEAILEGIIPNDHDAAFEYLLRIKDQKS